VKRTIVIVGGGVAGIAAAVRVAEAGARPVLVETRRKLGGRATSFVDPRSGLVLDNCQHVVMGCCSNILDLYQRLGVLDRIEWHDTTYWANPPHEPDVLAPSKLPAPGHFSLAFLRMKQFTLADKRAIARAMWAILRMGLRGRQRWRGRPFSDLLQETRQPDEIVRRFWDAIIVSACNMPVDRCDAAYALQVFQEGFLGSAWAATMGISTVPLLELYDRAEELVAREGGEVLLGTSVKGIAYDGGRVTGVVTEHGFIAAAAVVSTVPADRLDKLCGDALRRADRRLVGLDRIEPSPILGVHLFFDAEVLDTPHLVLPGRPTQWLFGKGRSPRPDADGDDQPLHHVHAVISGAEAWNDLDEPSIVAKVMEDVHWALPKAKGLAPVAARSVKEKRATFALVPGIDALRPSVAPDARGGVGNLFLAGDWVDTGWPATMEGACRSGYAAAAAATGGAGVVADVPIGPVARLLGLGR
jgi:zeta-carotene desaturase